MLPDVVTGSNAGDTASGHGSSVTVPAPNLRRHSLMFKDHAGGNSN